MRMLLIKLLYLISKQGDAPSRLDKPSDTDTHSDTGDTETPSMQDKPLFKGTYTPIKIYTLIKRHPNQNRTVPVKRTLGGRITFMTGPIDAKHYSSIAYRIKLPNLVLPRFKGDLTIFQSFWDSFQSAVNNNPALLKIEKINYFKSLLDRVQLLAIYKA